MKTCTKCNVEKPLSEFRVRKDRPSGFYSSCKKCERNYQKMYVHANKEKIQKYKSEWQKENKEHRNEYQKKYKKRNDKYFSVYLLPEENYVGQTNGVKVRMWEHKAKGRDITGYKILHTFDTREEALKKEAEYHAQGYNG